MDNVWYATPDLEDMGAAACAMGVKPEHILIFKNGTADIHTEMKFDYVISNPPYNPKDLWKNFVNLQVSLLKDNNSKMVTIHPSSWRESSSNEKFFKEIKNGIIELHINDYEVFKENKIGEKTDWYIYSKNYIGDTKIVFSNKDEEILNIKNVNKILRFSSKSIVNSILNKVASKDDNNIIILSTGNHPLYRKKDHGINGKYKQCGTEGKGTDWTKGDFTLTENINKHQFENKVIMSYAGHPRAKYFTDKEGVGVVYATYWLTNNKSLPILLNSKLLWKLHIETIGTKPWIKNDIPLRIKAWLLRSINFDGLKVKTEEELYKHYKLTQEEINWVENE